MIVTYFFIPKYNGITLEQREQIENDDPTSSLEEEEIIHALMGSQSDDSISTGLLAKQKQSYGSVEVGVEESGQVEEEESEDSFLQRTSYIPLEHPCLRPSRSELIALLHENDDYFNMYHEDFNSVDTTPTNTISSNIPSTSTKLSSTSSKKHMSSSQVLERKKRKDGYEMLEIIQTTDNYAMDMNEEDDWLMKEHEMNTIL